MVRKKAMNRTTCMTNFLTKYVWEDVDEPEYYFGYYLSLLYDDQFNFMVSYASFFFSESVLVRLCVSLGPVGMRSIRYQHWMNLYDKSLYIVPYLLPRYGEVWRLP